MSQVVKYDFSGQVALVTGAGTGMGLATAQAYAEAGAAVVLADLKDGATQPAADLAAAGYRVLAVSCDVADEAQVRALIEQTVTTFGRLDMAFNNAGVMQHNVETAELPLAEWDRVQGINLRGVYLCLRYQLAQMLKQGSGAIVNNASVGGYLANKGLSSYTASKHAVIGLTKNAGIEYAPKGIRVNAVGPGTIETPLVEVMIGGDEQKQQEMVKAIPLGRFGRPDEIAQAVLWLSSPAASYVVGQCLVVDGGLISGL